VTAQANLTELLDALSGKFCITWGVAEFAAWRRRVPWRWPRVLPKWYVEWKREELRKQAREKEKTMLELKGTAQFVEEGTNLKLSVRVQPHFPVEHEMLERVAASEDNTFRMERGCLAWDGELAVPAKALEGGEPPSQPGFEEISANEEHVIPGDLVVRMQPVEEMWTAPKRVLRLSEDGECAFFEDSLDGVPVNDLLILPEAGQAVQTGEEPPKQN